MIRCYISEFDIYIEKLSDSFAKYEYDMFRKWVNIKQLTHKDVLQHTIPFILEVERGAFYEFVNDSLLSFCDSKKCNIGSRTWLSNITVGYKSLVLITIHTQTPTICVAGCCFRFDMSQISNKQRYVCIKKCGCLCRVMKYSDTNRREFDEWLSRKTDKNNVLAFSCVRGFMD